MCIIGFFRQCKTAVSGGHHKQNIWPLNPPYVFNPEFKAQGGFGRVA